MKRKILVLIMLQITLLIGANITDKITNNYIEIKNSNQCINSENGSSFKRELKISKNSFKITTKNYKTLNCKKETLEYINEQLFSYKVSGMDKDNLYSLNLVLLTNSNIKNRAIVSTSHNIKLYSKLLINENREIFITKPTKNRELKNREFLAFKKIN